jgi:hypothetical protein
MMNDPNSLVTSGEGPYLIVATTLNEKVALRFIIRNTSSNIVNLTEVFVAIEKGAPLQVDMNGWYKYVSPIVLTNSKTELAQYFWQSSKTLLPGDVDNLPSFSFSEYRTNGFVDKPFIVMIKIRAQNVDLFGLRFFMDFPALRIIGHPKPVPPFLFMNKGVSPTNNLLQLNILDN